MPTTLNSTSRWAQWLGYAGLIPFAALAAAVWWVDLANRPPMAAALLAYSAPVLAFLGAIYWGFAMVLGAAGLQSRWWLLWGVVPSLIASIALLIALLLGPAAGLWLVAAALWICLIVDSQVYPKLGLQEWLLMRLVLTVGASVSCAVAGLALTR